MSKQTAAIAVFAMALAVFAMFTRFGAQPAFADPSALDFNPSVISLEHDGDFVDVSLVATGLGISDADTVQVNIQHDGNFTITNPACGTSYPTGSASGPVSVTGGTAFVCGQQNGPGDGNGEVVTFRVTKVGENAGQSTLTLLGDAGSPFRTTFFEAGSEVTPGTLGSLTVWDLLAPLSDQSVNEGLSLGPITITSEDLVTPAALTATVDSNPVSNYPFITYLDNGDGTADFTFDPQLGVDAGTYAIDVTANNGSASGTESFTLTVNGVNMPPVLTAIGDQSVPEDAGPFDVGLSATDPNGDGMTFSAKVDGVDVPTGFTAITADDGNGTGTITFTPGFFDAGTYSVEVTVTDDDPTTPESASDTFELSVVNVNRAPTITDIGDQSVAEGTSPPGVAISATDLDTDDTLTLSATLDGGSIVGTFVTLTDNGDGTGTLDFAPLIGEVGTYTVEVTVDDGNAFGTHSTSFTLTVTNIGTVTAEAGVVSLQALNSGDATFAAQFAAIAPTATLILDSDPGTTFTTAVNSDGSFSFADIPPDLYTLQVSAAGYFTHELTGIDLTTDDVALEAATQPVTMLGGLVDGDDTAGGLDIAALMASMFDDTSGGLTGRLDASSNVVDINADTAVTGQDLSILISNLGLTGAQPWQ